MKLKMTLVGAALTLMVLGAMANHPGSSSASEADDPDIQRVSSMTEAAQLLSVPLLELPVDPAQYTEIGITVSQHEGTWFVTASYHQADGNLMTFTQSNTTWDQPDADAMIDVEVLGVQAKGITGHNQAGTQIAQLYWRAGDVSVALVAAGREWQELPAIAVPAQTTR